jgi:hypothetical protein
VVERQPSKLRVAGSNPVSRSRCKDGSNRLSRLNSLNRLIRLDRFNGFIGLSCLNGFSAHVAQSAEHILGKDEVTGSIPVMGFGNAD